MAKHSYEEKQNNKIVITIIILLVIILVAAIGWIMKKNYDWFNIKNDTQIEKTKTIANEQLILKNNSDNKIVEYVFEDGKVRTIKIYEQFEKKEDYEEKKNTYEISKNDINIINTDDKKLSIEIERKDLGEDEGLTYDQVYDKYVNQLINIYTVI